MSWGFVAVGIGTAAAGYMGSKSQEKAADKQADSIERAQDVSSEAAAQARADALALFDPAFADISKSLNQSRGDLLSGRASAQDVLNQAFSQSANTLQTSNQQAMNAILGIPGQQQPQQAQPSLRQAAQPVQQQAPQQAQRPAPSAQQDFMAKPTSRMIAPTEGVGGLRDSAQATPAQQALQSQGGGFGYMPSKGFGASAEAADILSQIPVTAAPAGGQIYPDVLGGLRGEQPQASPVTPPASQQPMQPLEGEFIPASMPDAQFAGVAPQGEYGLAGAESALRQAMAGQTGVLTQGAQDALSSVRGGFDTARGDVTQGLDAGLSALRQGVETGRGDIAAASESAIGRYDPYSQAGQGALEREAALTGAMGPEAQAAAFASYSESPGQAYMREQQEKALLRSEAALGGLGGGNVRTALQEQAAGIASQNYQQDLENLRSLAGRGQQAAGAQAGLETQAGQNLSQLAMVGGQTELGAQQGAANQLAQLAAQSGMTEGQIQQMLGQNLSDVYGQTGANISGLRYGAGQDIAQQLGMTGQQLAQLQMGQGTALANIDQATAANIANLAAQQGQQTSGLRTGLASLLSNLATGQGTQQANLATQMGQAQASGVTNPWGNAISTLSGMVASNPSLLTNAMPTYTPTSPATTTTSNVGMV